MVEEFYRTPTRPRGARSGDVDPRPGEDPSRGGQKTYVSDPDGMKATEPNIESNEIDPGKRRPDGERAGDPKPRGEDRTAEKSNS